MQIQLLRTTDKDFAARFAKLKERGGVFESDVVASVKEIINAVRQYGDAALYEYGSRFGDLPTGKEALLVSAEELDAAASMASRTELASLRLAARRIRAYHQHQKERGYTLHENGAILGQKILPLSRVGIYAPGGLASYPSTILMAAIPARVAGVKEIILCSPQRAGEVNPLIAAAAKMCRVNQFFRLGGAQAIAALAYGTATVPRVDKIVGPGNAYVASAKMLVYGDVALDMVAGPSEVLIIADDTAPPEYIAADMIAQAEHDERASAVLVTTSEELAVAVAGQIAIQFAQRTQSGASRTCSTVRAGQTGGAGGTGNTGSAAFQALARFGAAIIVRNLEEAIAIANDYAPEHLEIMARGASRLLNKVKNAGSVFLGAHTPEALGDYTAGVNHILPTAGTARFASPLGVYDFTKRMSFMAFSQKAFLKLARATANLADAEGLTGHANSVRLRQASASATASAAKKEKTERWRKG